MIANVCVESHLREVFDQGFKSPSIVADVFAGPIHPQ
jgi:hypothetical protein